MSPHPNCKKHLKKVPRLTQNTTCQHEYLRLRLTRPNDVNDIRKHSGNIQEILREHAGNTQGTFREHSGIVPHLVGRQAGRVQELDKVGVAVVLGKVRLGFQKKRPITWTAQSGAGRK